MCQPADIAQQLDCGTWPVGPLRARMAGLEHALPIRRRYRPQTQRSSFAGSSFHCMGLPDANGLDLLRTLRSTSNIPIIILIGRSDETDRVVGLS
jgi:hypothetical protein